MEEELKKKLASELHDEIGSDLTALGINMTLMRNSLRVDESHALKIRINDSDKLIGSIRHSIRNIMGQLRPTGLDDLDLIAAVTHHVNDISHRTSIPISLEVDNSFPRLSDEKEIVLFRIIQEALTNILKYAEARHVTISLREERQKVLLSVCDDGRGFTPSLQNDIQGGYRMGLITMRERSEMLGGTFNLVSIPGKGTTVFVQL
ncbi:MAG: ATP-binding protein [Desulfuromonadales bacterium]